MTEVLHHPLNPVAKGQTFLTCKGCKWGQSWRGCVGECRHPDHMNYVQSPFMGGKHVTGKLTIGQTYENGSGVPAHFKVESEMHNYSPPPTYPTVTDLQCCSNWDEKTGS